MAEPALLRRVRGDGLELSVATWGDARRPAVVLVHGYPDTHAVWTPVAEALAADGFHVAAYDVRGAGASDAPATLSGYRLEHLVADLAAVLDEITPDAPAHVVGHDWGAIQGWHALADPNLDHRLASFTSISGLPLDHAARWLRAEARGRRFGRLLRQGLRSSYVGWFHLPGVHWAALRAHRGIGRTRPAWAWALRALEAAQVGPDWPAPTLGQDVARGMALYRANFGPAFRRPAPARPTATPVQLIVPTQDRFVPEWLFEGVEESAPDLCRRHLRARHWVIRSRPAEVAAWIAEHARSVGQQRARAGPAGRGA